VSEVGQGAVQDALKVARCLSEEILKVAGLSEHESEGKQTSGKAVAEVGTHSLTFPIYGYTLHSAAFITCNKDETFKGHMSGNAHVLVKGQAQLDTGKCRGSDAEVCFCRVNLVWGLQRSSAGTRRAHRAGRMWWALCALVWISCPRFPTKL